MSIVGISFQTVHVPPLVDCLVGKMQVIHIRWLGVFKYHLHQFVGEEHEVLHFVPGIARAFLRLARQSKVKTGCMDRSHVSYEAESPPMATIVQTR